MLPFLIGNIQRICYFLEEAVNPSPNISFLQALIPKGERHEEYLRSRLMDEYPFVHLMNKVVALTEGQEVTQNKRELLLALYHELEEISKNDIVPKAYMRKLKEAIQRVPVPTGELAPAMKLHQQLVSVGAYERLRQLDPKRATLLQTYLTTEKSAAEAGKEVGIQSRTRAHELLHSSMEVAFFALPEEDRLRFDNNPATALRI